MSRFVFPFLSRRGRAARRNVDQLHMLYNLTAATSQAATLTDVYEHSIDAILTSVHADRASILLFDPDGVMRFKAWKNLSEIYRKAVEGHSPWRQGTINPDAIVITDMLTDPSMEAYRPVFTAEGIRSLGFFPLVHQGRLLGKFMIYFNRPHEFTLDERWIIQTVGHHVAFGIQRQQAHENLEKSEARLTEQAEQLFRSNKELEQFAFVSSHDLKEPLRKVTNYAELLKIENEERLDLRSQKFISNILEGTNRMRSLIEDLLAFSRLGNTTMRPQIVDFEEILRQTLSDLESGITESGARVTHDELPTVLIDPSQMSQLLQNLIGNAIKFRTSEIPHVHIGAEKKDKEWIFYVRDNGIGFDKKYAEQIFMIFQRLHGKEKYPGTGIGLAICKKIVERHQGRIWAESEPGAGSTFYFSIPTDIIAELKNDSKVSI